MPLHTLWRKLSWLAIIHTLRVEERDVRAPAALSMSAHVHVCTLWRVTFFVTTTYQNGATVKAWARK